MIYYYWRAVRFIFVGLKIFHTKLLYNVLFKFEILNIIKNNVILIN